MSLSPDPTRRPMSAVKVFPVLVLIGIPNTTISHRRSRRGRHELSAFISRLEAQVPVVGEAAVVGPYNPAYHPALVPCCPIYTKPYQGAGCLYGWRRQGASLSPLPRPRRSLGFQAHPGSRDMSSVRPESPGRRQAGRICMLKPAGRR